MTPGERADLAHLELARYLPASAHTLLPAGSVILTAAEAEQVRQALIHAPADQSADGLFSAAVALLCGPSPKEPA